MARTAKRVGYSRNKAPKSPLPKSRRNEPPKMMKRLKQK